MDLLQTFFSSPQLSFDPLNFIGLLATVLVSFYIFKSDLPFDYVKEKHEKLIFPLFDLVEPFLYQQPSDSLWEKIFAIIEQNKSFADGKLLSLFYYCKKQPNYSNFISLCSYIDHAYDKSCHRLKLKCRSIEYRVNRNQYKNKRYFFLYVLLSALVFTLFLFIGISLLALFMVLVNNIFYATNETTKIILILFLSVTLLAICAYIDGHT